MKGEPLVFEYHLSRSQIILSQINTNLLGNNFFPNRGGRFYLHQINGFLYLPGGSIQITLYLR